jgi:predicted permease
VPGQLADRFFALLLKSFPCQQRTRYGPEMLDAFKRERMALVRDQGLWSALRFVVAAYRDVVVAGWSERRSEAGRPERTRLEGLFFGIWKDVKEATRSLARAWAFALVCLASLAIGLGINLAIVTLLWISLSPPPGVEVDGALDVVVTTRGLNLDEPWSFPDFEDVKRADTGMEVTGWVVGLRSLRTEDGADDERVSAMYVSANYFQTLGMGIAPGRAFVPEEDDVVGEPPVVVSFDMWENRLGADPQVVGRSLILNRTVHRVIGVTPRGFSGHAAGQDVDAWIPLWEHPRLNPGSDFRYDRSASWLQVLGRLEEGVESVQVNGALGAVMGGLAEAHPETNEIRGAQAIQYTKQGRGDEDWWIIKKIFLAMEVMALLIVSLNVAGMVLVRSATRERELALRMALGSSRLRLVRYLMTESALLAIIGGLLSLTVGWGSLRLLAWRIGQPFPGGLTLTLAAQSLAWSLVMMILIGLSPALKFSRPEILRALKDDGGVGGRRSSRIHRIATSLQAGVALPLLVITGMVLQSSQLLDEGDYGFQPHGLIVSTLDLAGEGYADEEVAPFMRRLRESVAALPGVESVSVADAVPLDYGRRDHRVSRAGEFEAARIPIQGTRATEGYFETIGTPILSGRGFQSGDVAGSEAVAVITESLAERLWPNQGALGQRASFSFDRRNYTDLTVVGIIGDVVGSSHESASANIFVSQWQNPTQRTNLVVRASSEDAALLSAVRGAILELDDDLTQPQVVTSQTLMDGQKGGIHDLSLFFGGISALMLFLAAIGVYGVVDFAVTNRTREIGVRMAVGASRSRVLILVLMDGVKLAIPGIAGGSLLAVVISQIILASMYDYFGRTAVVWTVLGLSVGAALGVVLLASSIPARRATGVHPIEALKGD